MPQLPSDTQLRMVESIDDVFAMKSWLGERRDVLGLDTETTGLNPYENNATIRLIQIGDHKTGWAVPYHLWGGAALECMNLWDGRFTLHNAAFDAKWLSIHADWHMPWHRTDDTMIMGQIANPGGRNDLKHLSTLYVDPRADAGQKDLKAIMKKNDWGWHNIPLNTPEFWIYSALDPVLAAHLWSFLRVDQSFPATYDLEMSVRRICTEIEMRGMRVDIDYSKEKFKELKDKVETAKSWAKDNWGISITSNPQLADFYANQLGATFDVFSPATGAPSVNKAQMALFEESDRDDVRNVTKFILQMRHADKMSNSYFKNFIEMNHDGIVYPSIMTMGARTGRMSVRSPALQTLPSKDSLIRNAFIPTNEGDVIISCDFSQIELRLMAHFSNDDKLQQAFRDADRTGEDFFTNMGKEVYNDPNFSKDDPRRKLVKGMIYGLLYGAGVQKMADTAGIPFAEMDEVVKSVNKAYPGISQFMSDTEAIGNQRQKEEGVGYIVTGTGRKIPCDLNKSYTLVNFTLQANAAEIMKQALVKLDAAGYGPYMVMVIHDEVVFSLPEHMVEKSLPEITALMSVMDGSYAVDLPAEPEGPFQKWGEKYEH